MKFILVLALLIVVAYAQNNFYRVATHIGGNPPQSIGFKTCGISGTSWVHGKNGPRYGYGVDLAPTVFSPGLCAETVSSGTFQAPDVDVGMIVQWSDDDNDHQVVAVRTNSGDVSYGLSSDCSTTTSAAEDSSSSAAGWQTYNDVNFFYGKSMRSAAQAWYIHTEAQTFSHSVSGTFSLSSPCSGSLCKSRVQYDTAAGFTGQFWVNVTALSSSSVEVTWGASGACLSEGPSFSVVVSSCGSTSCSTLGTLNSSTLLASAGYCSSGSGSGGGGGGGGWPGHPGKRQPLANSA